MFDMQEAVAYYKKQGAPADQTALLGLLKELQAEFGGIDPAHITEAAELLETKESLLLALVRRMPSLRLTDRHVLELCAGPNCGKHTALAAEAERLCKEKGVTLRFIGCQRMCGKGPNIRFDGKLYHKADAKLLQKLLEQ
jgi:NADH:ubiquinone oxidoreductase subunit E